MATKTYNTSDNFTNISGTEVVGNAVQTLNKWPTALRSALLALYEFEDGGDLGKDTIGDFNCTNSGVAQTTIASGSGGDFTADYMYTASAGPVIGNNFSISFWLYTGSNVTTAQALVSKSGATSTTKEYYLEVSAGELKWYIYNGNTAYGYGGTAISANTLYHVAFTWESGVGTKLYLNAASPTAIEYTGAHSSGVDKTLEIGGRNAGAKLTAKMGQIALLNITLSAAQITSLYNSGAQLGYATATSGDFLIHDSGVLYGDAKEDHAFDNSTAANTTTPTATYQYADYTAVQSFADAAAVEAGASWNGSWLTLTQLKAVTDTKKRYRYLKTHIDGVGDYASFSIDNYTVDVIPPTVPADTKFSLLETDNYALIWTEPVDADFVKCELRRTVDGTDEYLQDDFTWSETNTSPAGFADGSETADCPRSNYIDEDVAGTTIAYYVRSVDNVDNASAWTAFSNSTLESTDPGVANVLKDVTYKIDGEDKVGTFDENARNTDPGVANVVEDTEYIIRGVSKVGTLVLTADAAEAGTIAFGGMA